MKFCQFHWDALRAAIDAQGVSHLVAKSGREAANTARREIEGSAGPDDFDPLMAAHNMITERALKEVGLQLFMTQEDGSEYCPICALNVPEWIDKAAEGAANYARSILRTGDGGLVP